MLEELARARRRNGCPIRTARTIPVSISAIDTADMYSLSSRSREPLRGGIPLCWRCARHNVDVEQEHA
jgi:hypothetical protein